MFYFCEHELNSFTIKGGFVIMIFLYPLLSLALRCIKSWSAYLESFYITVNSTNFIDFICTIFFLVYIFVLSPIDTN